MGRKEFTMNLKKRTGNDATQAPETTRNYKKVADACQTGGLILGVITGILSTIGAAATLADINQSKAERKEAK